MPYWAIIKLIDSNVDCQEVENLVSYLSSLGYLPKPVSINPLPDGAPVRSTFFHDDGALLVSFSKKDLPPEFMNRNNVLAYMFASFFVYRQATLHSVRFATIKLWAEYSKISINDDEAEYILEHYREHLTIM
jgi:hypothetical protein